MIRCCFVMMLLVLSISTLQSQVTVFADKSEGCDSLTVSFQGRSDLTVTSWQWYFGDGSSSTLSNPVHTFDTTGVFEVWLYVNNKADSASTDIVIHRSPGADFRDTLMIPESSFKVYFQDVSTVDPRVSRYQYAFDFNDDGNFYEFPGFYKPGSIFPNPDKYTSPGPKTVSMEIADELGCRDTVTKTITVVNRFDIDSLPHAFSPNEDNQNDLFTIESNGVDPLQIKIFSRTGMVIYENTSTSIVWDGKTPVGLDAPPGVYYYILKNMKTGAETKEILYLFR